jgi:hypothetical protein
MDLPGIYSKISALHSQLQLGCNLNLKMQPLLKERELKLQSYVCHCCPNHELRLFIYLTVHFTNILSPGLFFITLILLDSTLELTF